MRTQPRQNAARLSRFSLLAGLLLAALPAAAQPGPARPPAATSGMALEAGAGRVIQLSRPAVNVFAANPAVAEVRPASPTSLFVFGVGPGRTTIAAVDAEGQPVTQFEVTVRLSSYAAGEAAGAIRRALPGRDVRVEARPNGLALSGRVASAQEAEAAIAAARSQLAEGQQIDNRLSVQSPAQVNLRVRIAEVNRSVTRQLGINWTALGNIGRLAVNVATNSALADVTNLPAQLGLGTRGSVNVNSVIDALAQDQLVHVLAEPNLTAMSGETASFLVGGEFPIPISSYNNTVSVQFKQYGISLAFVPTVLANNRISLRVRPEVSELTTQGAVTISSGNSTLQIPALTVRRADTTIEVGSGQGFAIAGLLSDTNRTTGRGLPWLGEVPVLGALFRSDAYQRNETELVIVVTPVVVEPVSNPDAIRTPVDRYVPPTLDAERVLFFRQRAAAPRPLRMPGDAGFSLR
jgi:pilus assembly protein CpaC